MTVVETRPPPQWLTRAALLALAAMLGQWAVAAQRFRDAEGSLAGSVCVPLSLAVALVIVASVPRRFFLAAGWLGLLIAGQAAGLQLIDAGPALHYQHHHPFERMPRVALTILACEALLVSGALLRRRRALPAAVRRLGPVPLAAVAAASFATAAAPSADLALYARELPLAFALQLLHLGALVLAVRAWPDGPPCGDATPCEFWRPRDSGADPLVVVAALWVVLVSGLLAATAYERHPHVPDEVAYLYQARLFASGRLALPAPPVPEAFEIYLFEQDGERWYPTTNPGWPALLALGVLAGAPWLVNPVLGGIGVLLAFALLRPLVGARDARAAALLLGVSPWYLLTSMSFMTHAATLTLALGAGIATHRARERARWEWAVVAGALCGAVSLVRPLDGLIVAVLAGMALLPWRHGWLRLTALFAGAVLVGGLVLPFNEHLTGDPLRNPLRAYSDRHFAPFVDGLGFGPRHGRGWALDPFPGHGPRDAFVNGVLNAFSVSSELFGWACGSIFFAGLAVSYRGGESWKGRLRLLLAPILLVAAAYSLHYYSGGPDFGARYWYLMIVPLTALTVCGWREAGRLLGRPEAGGRLAVLLAAAALVTWMPWRAIDKYHHFRGMRGEVRELARELEGAPLVLIQGEPFPDYASIAVLNPLDWRAAAPLFARQANEDTVQRLRAAFPERRQVLLEGPTRTGAGYRLAPAGSIEVPEGP